MPSTNDVPKTTSPLKGAKTTSPVDQLSVPKNNVKPAVASSPTLTSPGMAVDTSEDMTRNISLDRGPVSPPPGFEKPIYSPTRSITSNPTNNIKQAVTKQKELILESSVPQAKSNPPEPAKSLGFLQRLRIRTESGQSNDLKSEGAKDNVQEPSVNPADDRLASAKLESAAPDEDDSQSKSREAKQSSRASSIRVKTNVKPISSAAPDSLGQTSAVLASPTSNTLQQRHGLTKTLGPFGVTFTEPSAASHRTEHSQTSSQRSEKHKKTLVKEERSRSAHHLRQLQVSGVPVPAAAVRGTRMLTTDGKCQRCWEGCAKCLTCWASPKTIEKCFDKADPSMQQAWREKTALVTIFFLMMSSLAYFTFAFQSTMCPPPPELRFSASMIEPDPANGAINLTPGRVMILGNVYELGSWWIENHPAIPNFDAQTLLNTITGYDMSFYFPGDTPSCPSAAPRKCSAGLAYPLVMNNLKDLKAYCHPRSYLTDGRIKPLGPVSYGWESISNEKRDRFVFSGQTVDVGPFQEDINFWLDKDKVALIRSALRSDASHLFGGSSELIKFGKCLVESFGVGPLELETFVCNTAQIILWISLIVISALVAVRFVLAIAFSWTLSDRLGKINQTHWFSWNRKNGKVETAAIGTGVTAATHPQSFSLFRNVDLSHRYRELYTMILVTCYSEGEEGLRATMDSLTETDYPDPYKLIFVVADGIVKGAGNKKPTGDIVLDMIDLDPVIHGPIETITSTDPVSNEEVTSVKCTNDEAYSYIAIGSGSKKLNAAKVYCGTYEHKGKKVAVVLVYKWGAPNEHGGSKPGNRGKRDSQIILMDFLGKIMFDEPMTPHQFDLFTKWTHIMTVMNGGKKVTPDLFEILLMVDADTKVMTDSLTRMVAVMQRDPTVMGLCGETRIMNKNESWVTMIQVFEYHISHHLVKSFESVFGGVTCLPGCFCMYRIKAPKPIPNRIYSDDIPPEQQCNWVPIVNNPDIIADYSESTVDTLHKKNLLLLGEDRYLTTLMLRMFPRRKMLFVPKALCKTQVPAEFQVLLSQRRRWINSTIHNMFELVLVNQLCGIFCFSMQFVIGLELFGTLTLPAAITFTTAVLIVAIVSLVAPSTGLQFPATPLILLAGILGLPAILIVVTTRRMIYIWYMVIYLFALPIWNFVLPTYAWWHFDDFSWGQTRQVAGEKKGGDAHGHGGGEHEADPTLDVPKRRWVQWEKERLNTLAEAGLPDPVGRLITPEAVKKSALTVEPKKDGTLSSKTKGDLNEMKSTESTESTEKGMGTAASSNNLIQSQISATSSKEQSMKTNGSKSFETQNPFSVLEK